MKPGFQFIRLLDELGYLPIRSNTEEILHEAVTRSFESLGNSACKALLNNICSIHGLSEKELFTNYDLFENSLYNILGNTAHRVIRIIKRELLTIAVISNNCNLSPHEILDPSLTVNMILNDIRIKELCEFVKLSDYQHLAVLFYNSAFKEKLFHEFVSPSTASNAPKGIIMERPEQTANSLFNISYQELKRDSSQNKDIVNNLLKWIKKITSYNKSSQSPRIVQDGTWWLKNGMANELLSFEHQLEKEVLDKISFLCYFDITNIEHITPQLMKSIVALHKYVIIDEPEPTIYSSKSIGPNLNEIHINSKGREYDQ